MLQPALFPRDARCSAYGAHKGTYRCPHGDLSLPGSGFAWMFYLPALLPERFRHPECIAVVLGFDCLTLEESRVVAALCIDL